AALIDAHGGRLDALVCDVGGGTTDLSLLRLTRAPDPAIKHIAINQHLLLKKDNINLTLSHTIEPQMAAPSAHLDPHRFAQLWLACQAAKKRLLNVDPPNEI